MNNTKRYHSLDIIRGLAALSVLLTHWIGWTIGFADYTTQQVMAFFQYSLQFLLWGGGDTPWGCYFYCSQWILYSSATSNFAR